MKAIKLKIGRDILIINENDVIMDNRSSYQIITREKYNPATWSYYHIKMSTKLFRDLKKCGFLYTNKELEDYAFNNYIAVVTLYKFDIDAMIKAGYEFCDV